MLKILELRQKRAGLIAEARKIVEAGKPGEPLPAEDETRYNKLMDEVGALAQQVERLERQEQMEHELAESAGRAAQDPQPGAGAARGAAQPEYRFMSAGMAAMSLVDLRADPQWARFVATATPEYARDFRHWLQTGEHRALAVDPDTSGGYLLPPIQWIDSLIKAVDNLVFVRPMATVYTVGAADSLGAPALTADPADPTWTSELGVGSEDSTMAFGARELTPHPLAKYLKISRKLLRKVPSTESLVQQRLAYKFAVTLENVYLNGTGVGQPLGVFTASAQGINTDRDVSTGNTTTTIQFDGLIEAKYTLKGQYWPRARWLFHRTALKQIAKLQDDDGQYIWRESVRVGEPDMLLGLPYLMSEYAPSTFTTGLYVGVLADWSNYWIADSLSLEMQRLIELYAATNQVGYIARFETDGMPVLSEAFVRVALA